MKELILYTGPGNASERVLWALNYKNVAFEARDTRGFESREAYLKISPFGYVPALIIDGTPIGESIAMIEYLESMYPEPPLFPGSPLQQARIREVSELINSSIHPAQNRSVLNFMRPELQGEALMDLRKQWLEKGLKQLQPRLWQDSAFAVGEAFSQADIFVGVIFKRALTQGIQFEDFAAYSQYLDFLFAQEKIAQSAPFHWPLTPTP